MNSKTNITTQVPQLFSIALIWKTPELVISFIVLVGFFSFVLLMNNEGRGYTNFVLSKFKQDQERVAMFNDLVRQCTQKQMYVYGTYDNDTCKRWVNTQIRLYDMWVFGYGMSELSEEEQQLLNDALANLTSFIKEETTHYMFIEDDPRNDEDYDTYEYGTEPLPGDETWVKSEKAQTDWH